MKNNFSILVESLKRGIQMFFDLLFIITAFAVDYGNSIENSLKTEHNRN